MRNILSEVLKMAEQFPSLKVVGTSGETTFLANSECSKFIFSAQLKQPIAEFEGEFGITNLKLLRGLVNLPAYQTDRSTFRVKRRKIGDREIVEQLEFATSPSSRSAATFRLTSPDLIGEVVTLKGKPTWDVAISPNREKVSEFQQLAALYGEVSKTFTISTEQNELLFSVGNANSSTHNASMVFATGVTGTVVGDLNYAVAMFISVMKLAATSPVSLSIKSKTGPIKITVETDVATYDYYIRGARA